MDELELLKQRYLRKRETRAGRIDIATEIVLREIDDVERYLREILGFRKELRSLYDDDAFALPSTQRAVRELRRDIATRKAAIVKLGFERYIPPDPIDEG